MWTVNKGKKNSVNRCYTTLLKQSGNWDNTRLWKMIWTRKAPVKVVCLGWPATRGAYLTQNYLQKRVFLCATDATYVKMTWNQQIIYFFTAVSLDNVGTYF